MRMRDIIESMTKGIKEENASTPLELLGAHGWFEVYVPKAMGAQRRKAVMKICTEATKALSKIGFRQESERLVVLPSKIARMITVPNLDVKAIGTAHTKDHYIKAVYNDNLGKMTETIVHEWAHNHYARLPKYLKESWHKLWLEQVARPSSATHHVDKTLGFINDTTSRQFFRFYHDIANGFNREFATIGIQHHKPLENSSDSDLAFLMAFWPYKSGIEVKLKKPVGPYKVGDKLNLEGGYILTNAKLINSVLNSTSFFIVKDPEQDLRKLAQLVDVDDMREEVKEWPYGSKILDLEKKYLEAMRGHDPDNSQASVGSSVLALDATDHKSLVEFVKGCILGLLNNAFDAATRLSSRDEKRLHDLKEEIANRHAEEITQTWTQYLKQARTKDGNAKRDFQSHGLDSMESLAYIIQKHIKNDAIDLAKKFAGQLYDDLTARIQNKDGESIRSSAKSLGLVPTEYGATNEKELWATTVEAMARGTKVPKYLAQAVRDIAQGKTPAAL